VRRPENLTNRSPTRSKYSLQNLVAPVCCRRNILLPKVGPKRLALAFPPASSIPFVRSNAPLLSPNRTPRCFPMAELNFSRVEMWRGCVGTAYLLPALSSTGASLAGPCSVSTSRSSNRTCGATASGSRRRLTRSPTEGWQSAGSAGLDQTRRAGGRRDTAWCPHPALCAWRTATSAASGECVVPPPGRLC
jgi:hypothetical protein